MRRPSGRPLGKPGETLGSLKHSGVGGGWPLRIKNCEFSDKGGPAASLVV